MILPQPVNKFPQLIGYLTQRLKTLCPTLGKRTIAALLARAGLHLSTTTVSRMLRNDYHPTLDTPKPNPDIILTRVIAKRPNHVWRVDLTTMPIVGGLVFLVAVGLAAMLAFLLVGGRSGRSFLARAL